MASCATSQHEPISVGMWTGTEFDSLPPRMALTYGPQGGQHVLVDVELYAQELGAVNVELELIEDGTGELVGSGSQAYESDTCPSRIDAAVIFLETDRPLTGTVHASATRADGCSVEMTPIKLVIDPSSRPPR